MKLAAFFDTRWIRSNVDEKNNQGKDPDLHTPHDGKSMNRS
jgi:hypothetical protein